MRKLAIAALTVAALGLAAPAWATQGEHEFSVGAAGGDVNGPWAGLDARWLYDLTDFWAIGAGFHQRMLWNALPAGREAAAFEARFVLDALQWIPSIGAGIGGSVGQNDGATLMPWAHLDAGVDYRPARKWSIGARIGAEFVGTARPGDASYGWVGGIFWNWYGGSGIGLDL